MGRGPLKFRHSDVVRAIKALQAAGLTIVRTEFHPDGRVVVHHVDGAPEDPEKIDLDEWWSQNVEKRGG